MKNRNPFVVALLSLVTFGIYTIVWYVKTKGELVKRGGDIPTAWLLLVPFANLYWLYKYFKGAEKVTSGRVKGLAFFMILIITSIASAVVSNLYGGGLFETTQTGTATDNSPVGLLAQVGLSLISLSVLAYVQSSYNKVTGGAPSPQPAPAEPTPQQ